MCCSCCVCCTVCCTKYSTYNCIARYRYISYHRGLAGMAHLLCKAPELLLYPPIPCFVQKTDNTMDNIDIDMETAQAA